MTQVDIFYGRKTQMLLVFSGFYVQCWHKRWHQLSNTNHHPYIAKDGYLRILSECISTILPIYRGRGQRPRCSWKHKQDSASHLSYCSLSRGWITRNGNPRDIGNAPTSCFYSWPTQIWPPNCSRECALNQFVNQAARGYCNWIESSLIQMTHWSTYRGWGNKSTSAVLLGAGTDW